MTVKILIKGRMQNDKMAALPLLLKKLWALTLEQHPGGALIENEIDAILGKEVEDASYSI